MKETFTYLKIFIALFACLFSSQLFSQWIQQVSGVNVSLNDVYCIDQNNVIVVGNNGTILKTTNGGTNWVLKNSGTTEPIVKVVFPTATIGYAIATNYVNNIVQNRLLKSTDGGESWSSITNADSSKIADISFYDSTTLYIISDGLKKSIDGCTTFTDINAPANIRKIKFINAQVAFASTADKLYKTVDGGTTWSLIHQANGTVYYGVNFDFSDENYGVIYSDYEKFVTTDGGVTNTMIGSYNGINRDAQVINENINWEINNAMTLCGCSPDCVSNSDYIQPNATQDDFMCFGTTTYDDVYLNAFHFTNNLTGFLVGYQVVNSTNPTGPAGNYGAIYKNTTGTNLLGVDKNLLENKIKIYPNPASENITIDLGESNSKSLNIDVIDSIGKIIFSESYTNQNKVSVNLSQFSEGVYFVKITNDDKQQIEKLIVR